MAVKEHEIHSRTEPQNAFVSEEIESMLDCAKFYVPVALREDVVKSDPNEWVGILQRWNFKLDPEGSFPIEKLESESHFW